MGRTDLADVGTKAYFNLLFLFLRFSIQQCRQTYAFMDMDLKANLRDKLDTVAPEYGLVELTYPSFTRAHGYRCSALSAADAVEGINALLEAATGIRVVYESEGGKGGGEWFGGTKIWNVDGDQGGKDGNRGKKEELTAGRVAGNNKGQDEEGEEEMDVSMRVEMARYRRNFWVAYDAIQE